MGKRKNLKNLKFKHNILFICYVIFLILFFGVAFFIRHKNLMNYNQAKEHLNSGRYEEAEKIYDKLGDFKQSKELKRRAQEGKKNNELYTEAMNNADNNDLETALQKLNKIEDIESFEDGEEKIKEIKYKLAKELYDKGDYVKAKDYFQDIKDYNDTNYYLSKIDLKLADDAKKTAYEDAVYLYKNEQYEKALDLFTELGKYKKSKSYAKKCNDNIKRKDINNVIAAGVRNSVAITDEGHVLVSGTNDNGQKGVDDFKDIISVDVYGQYVACLNVQGKVVFSGKDFDGVSDVKKWKNIRDVAVGENFIVGLDKDGKVNAEGHGNSGQLKVQGWKNVIAIDAGWSFTVALTKDKKLLYAGADNGQKEEFAEEARQWKKVINISASGGGSHRKQRGKGHTVGLRSDGKVVAVGDNTHGQCDVSEWKDIIKIDTGDWYTVGLDIYGKVHITGENFEHSKYIEYDVLEKCTDIVDIAAGFGQTLCLRKNGTLSVFGFNDENKIKETKMWRDIRIN